MNKQIFTVCFVGAISMMLQDVKALPNPWIDCKEDIHCGSQKAGFDFPLQVENYTVRAMEGMFELRFPLKDGRNVVVRKSLGYEGEADENGIIDISGDYNVYPINKTITLENGVNFNVRGDEDNYKVVNFAAETGYYSIICNQGLSKKDIEEFYELLQKSEEPKKD